MRIQKQKILGVLLAIVLLTASSYAPAQQQAESDNASAAKPESSMPVPNLAEFIPLAAHLSGRLAALENNNQSRLDISALEMKYGEIDSRVNGVAAEVQQLRDSKKYRYGSLSGVRAAVQKEEILLQKINEPLEKAILRFNTWRKDWLAEKKRWNQ